MLLAVVGVDVHAADHLAGRSVEDGVGEARPLLEVVGVPLQVAEVVQHAAVVWPRARFPAGRLVDVLHRRRPRLIVGVVVLRTEWFEPELLRRERERDDESGRDKRRLAHSHILVDPTAGDQKNRTGNGTEVREPGIEGWLSSLIYPETVSFWSSSDLK